MKPWPYLNNPSIHSADCDWWLSLKDETIWMEIRVVGQCRTTTTILDVVLRDHGPDHAYRSPPFRPSIEEGCFVVVVLLLCYYSRVLLRKMKKKLRPTTGLLPLPFIITWAIDMDQDRPPPPACTNYYANNVQPINFISTRTLFRLLPARCHCLPFGCR